MTRYWFQFSSWWVGKIARPACTGVEHLGQDRTNIYVLQQRAFSDLIMLELACRQAGVPSPLDPLQLDDLEERSRFFPLMRATRGRITMREQSPRMLRLLNTSEEVKANTWLIPTSVFWGRAMAGEGSVFRNLASEHWAVTGRIRRFINLFINRRNIRVHFGRPISLAEVAAGVPEAIAARRTARLLRVRLRQQKARTLGPDFSHRRTLINQVLASRSVREAITATVEETQRSNAKVERTAAKYARTIASDMSHPTVRTLARLLTWFWTKIYDGIELRGLEQLEELAETHSLVYLPSHRSHLDYLLLSYLLYYRGHMIPHIAAGDNLNLPILGRILRRGGAFFMRRSFRGDALYLAVFEEYLFQVYRQGHPVEFFPEGGRSRTGRLLPPKFGLLKMTITSAQRGLPKPLALVPVYLSYEKLVEGASYLSELRGADKKGESIMDLVRNLKLIRQYFGKVVVHVAEPMPLQPWLAQQSGDDNDLTAKLGTEVMQRINGQAFVNPVNIVALITLATPKSAIDEPLLLDQIRCYQKLLAHACELNDFAMTDLSAEEIIARSEKLSLLHKEENPYGTIYSHDPNAAVLMTWYRNNVTHTLLLPSLIASLLFRRRRGMEKQNLLAMLDLIYPFLARELSAPGDLGQAESWLDCMVNNGLLNMNGDLYSTPSDTPEDQIKLGLLAHLVMHTLERMFIVLHLISSEALERDVLQNKAQQVAQKISRLYGINAPEFSDPALFNLFIDGLLSADAICKDENDLLHKTAVIDEVIRAAVYVIEPQIRYGVISAVQTHEDR